MEVAATCATDHMTWRDALPPGESLEDGVRVHRFRVGPRDPRRFDELHARVLAGRAGYADDLEWLGHSRKRPEAVAAAADIAQALTAALADPEARTGDIRGRGTTATFTEAVRRNLAG